MIAPDRPVLLAVPPNQSALRPAIGVSQLKANLSERGIPAEVLYLNLRFADRIGLHLYERLELDFAYSLGEFVFSCLLYGRGTDDIRRYVEQVLRPHAQGNPVMELVSGPGAVAALQDLVAEARAFADDAVREILARNPWLVGFTSSVQDNLASLLLIRRIKEKDPGILTAMGGPNCQGSMGQTLFEQYPEIDYVGQGECDLSFVELVERLRGGETPGPLPGILSRAGGDAQGAPAMLRAGELEKLPVPDFDDYFAQVSALPSRGQFVPGLLVETSRGCHWGEKRTCRFCGLNGLQVAFRRKSGPRALAELRRLTEKHGNVSIQAVDRIVDASLFRDVFPALAEKPGGRLFWETGGSLTQEQARMLAAARVTHIQAGIESLSNKSLRLMDKPTSSLLNVQTLKWCAENGIKVSWSHLFGVPGESEDEVGGLAALMELIHHLPPPTAAHLVRLQRFSPYFDAPESYGLAPARPVEVYRHLYPFGDDVISRIAFHFATDFNRTKAQSAAFRALDKAVVRWRRAYKRAHLIMFPSPRRLTILDTRPCARRRVFRLAGLRREVYEHCRNVHGMESIRERLASRYPAAAIEEALESLVRDRLMVRIDGRYLSLATEYGPRYGRHCLFAGGPGGPMPGGHLRPLRMRELKSLLRRLHVSRGRIALFSVRHAPAMFRFVLGEVAGAVLARTIRAAARSRT